MCGKLEQNKDRRETHKGRAGETNLPERKKASQPDREGTSTPTPVRSACAQGV